MNSVATAIGVKVIHGANDDVFGGIAGITVEEVQRNLVDAFNIPVDAIALVNGEHVCGAHQLADGDRLEFCKVAARKSMDRLLSQEQIKEQYGIPDELWLLIAADVRPISTVPNSDELFLESTIDRWLKRRETGIDETIIQREVAEYLRRIADRLDPPPPDKVGTPYIADRLGCTTVWITELIRKKDVPANCIVPGTGNGKPWKFYRDRIDRWLKER